MPDSYLELGVHVSRDRHARLEVRREGDSICVRIEPSDGHVVEVFLSPEQAERLAVGLEEQRRRDGTTP